MVKKKYKSDAQNSGRYSPQALFQMKKKESELRLSSLSYCRDPYKVLDYSPFIYMQILEALNKQFCKKYKPIRITETTITNSSDYVLTNGCVVYPVFVKGQMYIFLENNDENKATYGLKIKKNLYFSIVENLKGFFSSSAVNKRTVFPTFVRSIEGVIDFKRFAHTSSKIWEQRIKEFITLVP